MPLLKLSCIPCVLLGSAVSYEGNQRSNPMRFNPDTETNAFASVDAAAVDLTNFPDLIGNDVVWDCQNGGWTLRSDHLAKIQNRQLVTV